MFSDSLYDGVNRNVIALSEICEQTDRHTRWSQYFATLSGSEVTCGGRKGIVGLGCTQKLGRQSSVGCRLLDYRVFLSSLVKQEVDSLPRSLKSAFTLRQQSAPGHLWSLPVTSVLRAVVDELSSVGKHGILVWLCHIIIIIIIKTIYNTQDPPKAANALSGSEKVWRSIYNVSYKQQCLQLGPKGRETTVRHSQRSRQAVPHRRSGNSKASVSVACVCSSMHKASTMLTVCKLVYSVAQ